MTKYERLTERQKEVFDLYIECRALSKVCTDLQLKPFLVYRIYDSRKFQEALQEHNEGLKNKVLYNEAVIIDKLWEEYSRADNSKDRISILAMLGKHIGMFATNPRDQSKPNIQYNIINYNKIEDEIKVHGEEVKAEIDRFDDQEGLPEGVEITNYLSEEA